MQIASMNKKQIILLIIIPFLTIIGSLFTALLYRPLALLVFSKTYVSKSCADGLFDSFTCVHIPGWYSYTMNFLWLLVPIWLFFLFYKLRDDPKEF